MSNAAAQGPLANGEPNDYDPHRLAEQLAAALAMPIAICLHDLSAEQRHTWWQGLFASLSGMAEASLGHDTTRAVLEGVLALKAVRGHHPLQ